MSVPGVQGTDPCALRSLLPSLNRIREMHRADCSLSLPRRIPSTPQCTYPPTAVGQHASSVPRKLHTGEVNGLPEPLAINGKGQLAFFQVPLEYKIQNFGACAPGVTVGSPLGAVSWCLYISAAGAPYPCPAPWPQLLSADALGRLLRCSEPRFPGQ